MDSVVVFQTGSGQDHAVCGKTGDAEWAVLYDGHGTNKVIDQLRVLNMDTYIGDLNPLESIASSGIKGDTYLSGATACMMRRIGNQIELFNMGDSGAYLYVNGKLVVETTRHTFLNEDELERTKPLIRCILPTKAPFPVSDERVEEVLSPTGHFNTGERLVPSRSIGHNHMTGDVAERIVVNVESTDHVRIVMGSDGLLDMRVPLTEGSALALATEAERRWRKPWKYKFMHNGKEYDSETTYGDQIDDISCVVYDDRIKHRPSLCIPFSPKVFTTQHVHDVFEQLFGGVRKVEEVEHENHRVFFIHFNPAELTERDAWKKILNGENVKAEYNESWWWPVKLMHGSIEMLGVTRELYDQWNGTGDYYVFEASLETASTTCKVLEYLNAFK